ncbi:MAG: dihydroorotase [Veillonellaceae bacterium]|nr:dihydroorotase [Veillonellaceae bacterium]
MKLLLKGGRVISPLQKLDDIADVLIDSGLITAIGKNLSSTDAKVYDAKSLIISPGLIDMHVHLREPGLEAKEDIGSGTRAAAAGGFTTIACMPNTKPVVDNSMLVAGIIQRAQAEGKVNVRVIGALSKGQEGQELAEIGDMILTGAVAISDDGHYVQNAQLLKNALEYTNIFNKAIISHAEDEALAGEGFMHEGAVSARIGLKGRPSVAEDIAVARDIMLAEYSCSPIHIAHVSSKGAVELIRQAKQRGVRVTAEVTPHHITLTDEDVSGFNPAYKVNPPLRSDDHREALIEGLKDGTIDVIASDHAPHAYEEKDREFRFAPSGFAGLETSLGVVLTSLYHTGRFSIADIIYKMSVAPARILGIEGGTLEVGNKADITIIDPDCEWIVDSSVFYTKGKHTPFDGCKLKGKAVAAIVGGHIVMRNGEVIE